MLGDKRVLITGAASGMGLEIAIEAARQGARRIGITDVNAEGLERATAQVEAAGAQVLAVPADLRDMAAIDALVATVADWAGGLDTLVNCAGVLDSNFTDPAEVGVHQISEEVWDTVMDINLKAVWRATHAAAPYLLASDRGPSVVNAASVAGMNGVGMTGYGVSKAAVIQLTRATAINLAPRVRANAFSPGSIKTPMSEAHLARAGDDPVERRARAKSMYGSHLIPRLGQVNEVAKLVCFLASDDASFLTGVNVPVDGGMTAWRHSQDVELDD